MKKKNSIIGIVYLLITQIFFLLGCFDNGNKPVATSQESVNSPETALLNLLKNWQEADNSPKLSSKSNSKILAADTYLGTITFCDLSKTTWCFNVKSVSKVSSNFANILTNYTFAAPPYSTLEINFSMTLVEGEWLLDDMVINKLPDVITPTGGTIQGYITDETSKTPLSGTAVLLTGSGVNKTTVSDGKGFYIFTEVPAGSYSVVFKRNGYVVKTIPNVSPIISSGA
ncbi:MAG: carboxypeptidase regulatory-like domain-containing protein [Candidatus Riflebacteria bacterium]|nr:carboxypeptidase regulatory-like domain-containing protein [Candidatus Riflebacteria bacterium]